MAEATTNIETTETVTGVTLELSVDEAKTIAAVLGNVGGDPLKSARRHADSIARALSRVGYAHSNTGLKTEVRNAGLEHGVYFHNDDGSKSPTWEETMKKVRDSYSDPYSYNYSRSF